MEIVYTDTTEIVYTESDIYKAIGETYYMLNNYKNNGSPVNLFDVFKYFVKELNKNENI